MENNKNQRNTNIDWLIERLRKAEAERDAAAERARELEIDNLHLRVKLQSISNYVSDEEYIADICIPDSELHDIDIPDEDTQMPYA